MVSKVKIISNAFVLLGKKPIRSSDTGSTMQEAATDIYDAILPDILASYTWPFATRIQSLSQLTTDPVIAQWKYQFQLPTLPKPILSIRIYSQGYTALNDYRLYQDKLYANIPEVELEYIFLADESDFPEYFSLLVTYVLAAHIALPVTEQPNLAKYWAAVAEKQKGKAMAISGQQFTNPVILRDDLYTAHFT